MGAVETHAFVRPIQIILGRTTRAHSHISAARRIKAASDLTFAEIRVD